ncbi:Carboxylic acid transporter protein -like protein [Trametes pubescens]|uniref:Carboxylic acid transporter protein-like protein n=1 Tax=Trametes pubescens TaxID=154538 RepID=A0A1M2W4I0_TRAPU|nr:Carboxylic acid transporter protein -like protein [Trametes pubescens]
MAPYFLRNLLPRREQRAEGRPLLEVLATLTWVQWGHFWSGWLAWTCDAIDFFSVSLSVAHLQTQFDRSTHDITTAITLTLLFRSIGAVVFGIISDRFGRKWPLIINLLMISVLELGSGFVESFHAFLAVRSLFGIAMGGIWGLAASTALENLPVEVRGLASGILQQGYAVGYLLAAVINLTLVPEAAAGWRSLFWTASGISAFAAFVRFLLPESEIFLRAQAAERARGGSTTKKTKIFLHETWEMLKRHWLLCIYAILLMTGFNFLSHGSQDLYPTYLTQAKLFTDHNATVATIIGNCGAIAIFVLLIGAFIPLWILPSSFGALAAGAFCIQFGVQGAWGVIPIQLAEISPPAFRATFPGVAYQIGNMVSSASAQIEATGAANLHTTIIDKNGQPKVVSDYATVQGILIGVVAAFVLVITIIGPENYGSHFEKSKAAFEEGAGRDEIVEDDHSHPNSNMASRPTSLQIVDEKRSTPEPV